MNGFDGGVTSLQVINPIAVGTSRASQNLLSRPPMMLIFRCAAAGGVDAGGVDAGGVEAGGVDAGGVDAGGGVAADPNGTSCHLSQDPTAVLSHLILPGLSLQNFCPIGLLKPSTRLPMNISGVPESQTIVPTLLRQYSPFGPLREKVPGVVPS